MFFDMPRKKNLIGMCFMSLLSVDEEEKEAWLDLAARWTQEKWGYMSEDSDDLYQRIEIEARRKDFYFIVYAGQPIGMFSLCDYNISDEIKCADKNLFMSKEYKARELTHVYIDSAFRALGLGKEIKAEVSRIMKDEKIDLLVFDTVTPLLNSFYMKNGWAREVCEGLSHESVTINGKITRTATTIMRI